MSVLYVRMDSGSAVPGPPGLGSAVLFCQDGTVTGPNIYTTWTDAVAAAIAQNAAVEIQIFGLTASANSNANLDNRISLVGVPPPGTARVTLTVPNGVVILNPIRIENIEFVSNSATRVVTIADNGTLTTVNSEIRGDGAGDVIGFSTGGTATIQVTEGSTLATGTSDTITAQGGTAGTIVVDGTSTVQQNTVKVDPGGSIALKGSSPNATIVPQTGTTVATTLEPWIFNLTGVYSDLDYLPADLDNSIQAQEDCQIISVTMFRQVAGTSGSTSIDLLLNGATSVFVPGPPPCTIAATAGDAATVAVNTFANASINAGDWLLPALTATETNLLGPPEGPANITVLVYRVKVLHHGDSYKISHPRRGLAHASNVVELRRRPPSRHRLERLHDGPRCALLRPQHRRGRPHDRHVRGNREHARTRRRDHQRCPRPPHPRRRRRFKRVDLRHDVRRGP